MLPTDLFWEYLKPILEAIEGVTSVALSDAERMDRLSMASRGADVYPAAFVMRPKYRGLDENTGVYAHKFKTTMYFFVMAGPEEAEQDAAYQTAERMSVDLMNKLFIDSKTYACLFNISTFEAEPVIYKTIDATYGYEVSFEVGLYINHLLAH